MKRGYHVSYGQWGAYPRRVRTLARFAGLTGALRHAFVCLRDGATPATGCPSLDQPGRPHPDDGAKAPRDIGAFESQGVAEVT